LTSDGRQEGDSDGRSAMIFRRKRTGWISETIAYAGGDYGDLHVVVADMPCLRDPATGRREYAFPDLGSEFRGKLNEAIAGLRNAMGVLEAGGIVRATVVLSRGDQIKVEITGRLASRPRQFDSYLSDALIAAFRSVHRRP
jgi:hypothetical protein